MSNFGMGSMLVNYYRKRDEKDEHIPKVKTRAEAVENRADKHHSENLAPLLCYSLLMTLLSSSWGQ